LEEVRAEIHRKLLAPPWPSRRHRGWATAASIGINR
jgi:hypothetical protein